MQGTVLSVAVEVGGDVRTGQLICVVEAMKMENELVAHRDGVVAELHVAPGEQVALGDVVCVIEDS
jgi:acetyl-CoA/propionyl-CoA carboxylase biotin carboxyl carrier protein